MTTMGPPRPRPQPRPRQYHPNISTTCNTVASFGYAEVGRNGGWLSAEEVRGFTELTGIKEEFRRRHELVFGIFWLRWLGYVACGIGSVANWLSISPLRYEDDSECQPPS